MPSIARNFMISRRTLREWRTGIANLRYRKRHGLRLERPVFIVGCGRSGTTILGRVLSRHENIHYMNEPRHVWAGCYPQTDIWSKQTAKCPGVLGLDETSCTMAQNQCLHDTLGRELLLVGKQRLVEKLPINAFRLPFLNEIFPDAIFIHIVRNGLDVARSIAAISDKAVQQGKAGWYGADDFKWLQLVKYAASLDIEEEFLVHDRTPLERGLLEWRLSNQVAGQFFNRFPADRHLEIRYEKFVDNPIETAETILKFIGLPSSRAVSQFASSRLRRPSGRQNVRMLNPYEVAIAGDLLVQLGYLKQATGVR
jgi:hypothetical protein